MASRDLDLLVPEFADRLRLVLADCAAEGVVMVPYCTLRDPWEQARLYRQSRPTARVVEQAELMRRAGAPWLAEVLLSVGPQATRPEVTRAAPGLSWHQWGEAVDCYHQDRPGHANWSGSAYRTYRANALDRGLTVLSWEMPHVQLREGSPRGWPEIESAMRSRWESRGPLT